jgi:hypothetical protein
MLIALLCALVGAVCLYLSSPNQRWLTTPMPAVPARLAGGLGCCAALYWLCLTMQILAACFVFLTVMMALLTALPCCGALLQIVRAKGARHHG